MVDIVVIAHAVLKMHVIADRSKDIVLCDMLRDQVVDVTPDHVLHFIDIPGRLFDNACKYRIIYLLSHSDFQRINVNNGLKIYHHIRKHLNVPGLVLSFYPQVRRGRVLDLIRDLAGDLCPLFGHNLFCQRAHYIFRKDPTCHTVFEHQLFIEFIASYFCQVITSRIKEHTVDQAFRTVYCQRLARTDLFVQL